MELNPKYLNSGNDTNLNDDMTVQSDDEQDIYDNEANENDADVNNQGETTYAQKKWRSLKKFYVDQYLDFFNNEIKDNVSHNGSPHLPASQVGAVVWSSDEKDALFRAVAEIGRHDLPRLSSIIGTKAPVEILAYLNAVRSAYIDRQLVLGHAKNLSTVDIPAAVEVGEECEEALNLAADALNAYQEQYDITAGQRECGMSWLIERQTATKLDVENDKDEPELDGQSEQQNEAIKHDRRHVSSLFKLSTMLDLSEQFFLNQPEESLLDHWHELVLPGQRPAMTEDFVKLLYDIVVDRLREILKLSIRIADARLSSMASTGYIPSHKLTSSDVTSALHILDMPTDMWDFWTGLARRNKLHVITGSHSKGETRAQSISYDVAEATLAIRRGRGRRRSMSIGSEVSSAGSDIVTDSEPLSGPGATDNEGDTDDTDRGQNSTEISEDEGDSHVDEAVGTSDSSGESSTGIVHKGYARSRLSREERKDLLENELEQYSETIDQATKVLEEKRLWQVLGKRLSTEIKEEEDRTLGTRPKRLRKTADELASWSCTYTAEWETLGHEFYKEHLLSEGLAVRTDAESSGTEAGG